MALVEPSQKRLDSLKDLVSPVVIALSYFLNFLFIICLLQDFLRMENNNFNGTMPFDKCDNFEVLSADCSAPRNIICPCCTRCYGYFTISDDVLPCPSSILSVKLFDYPNHLSFYVENEDNQLITEHDDYITGVMNSCISPTDCMTITSTSLKSFSVAIDDNILFDKIEGLWYGSKEIFGYASDGTMQPNTCDAYKICDRSLRPGTPQRKLFNLITRFSGLVSMIFQTYSNIYVFNFMFVNISGYF